MQAQPQLTRAPGRARRQGGFTLLEAIVALVILAGTGMALFSWINTSLISLNRAEQAFARASATQNAIAYLETVNPALQPTGSAPLGDLELSWESAIVEPLRDGVGYPGGQGVYQVGLFDVHATLRREGSSVTEFTLRQVGYEQVRE